MTNSGKIKVTILDDHQSIKDGYLYRLSKTPEIEVVAALGYGDELEPSLAQHPTDGLILDVGVPVSAENPSPYPILHTIPSLLQLHPGLNILVISMFTERRLIRGMMEAGASGYILKDDTATINELGSVVLTVSGTTAPFSAMSGPPTVTSLLSVGALAPSALIASATFLASKAGLLYAKAYWGNRPVVASRPATTALCLSVSRRVCIGISLGRIKLLRKNDNSPQVWVLFDVP